ncbi:MAG: response regulator transcription factor [Deltaproteobacteria bacterium]|nr:response regulator transcription factor [Deltaproteobacteria bacterium]
MSIKVIVADDHSIIREGIKTVIERRTKDIKVVGEAANGQAVLTLAQEVHADVFILDISMPLLNGIETTRRMVKQYPACHVIILSMHNDSSFVENALRAGAKGYLLKEDASEEVISAIRQVMRGRYFLSPNISEYVVSGYLDHVRNRRPKNEAELSSREKEILQLIAEGHSNKDVANQLDLSANTVQTHRKNIMRKLDVHHQADLIRYALKESII